MSGRIRSRRISRACARSSTGPGPRCRSTRCGGWAISPSVAHDCRSTSVSLMVKDRPADGFRYSARDVTVFLVPALLLNLAAWTLYAELARSGAIHEDVA